jgi:hypothetical protein
VTAQKAGATASSQKLPFIRENILLEDITSLGTEEPRGALNNSPSSLNRNYLSGAGSADSNTDLVGRRKIPSVVFSRRNAPSTLLGGVHLVGGGGGLNLRNLGAGGGSGTSGSGVSSSLNNDNLGGSRRSNGNADTSGSNANLNVNTNSSTTSSVATNANVFAAGNTANVNTSNLNQPKSAVKDILAESQSPRSRTSTPRANAPSFSILSKQKLTNVDELYFPTLSFPLTL